MSLPKTQEIGYYDDLLRSMEEKIKGINKQAIEFVKIDTNNVLTKKEYINNYDNSDANELYSEIRRGICEIFSVQDDYGYLHNEMYKFIIRYGVLFSAIATPAILKYFNSKLKEICDEIIKYISDIEKDINKLKYDTNTSISSLSSSISSLSSSIASLRSSIASF